MRQLKISKQFTNRENKSLDKYLNEISKVSMIDAQEEVVLAGRIREGDQAALEKLVNANLRFVVSVSKQYQNQGLTLGDLINEGNLGLRVWVRQGRLPCGVVKPITPKIGTQYSKDLHPVFYTVKIEYFAKEQQCQHRIKYSG
jgi:hypothetical protein